MMKYLLDKAKSFKKPLVMAEGEHHLSDFILTEDIPNTIIEVAGLLHDKDYVERLEEKESLYKERGYVYIRWDGKTSIDKVFNKGN